MKAHYTGQKFDTGPDFFHEGGETVSIDDKMAATYLCYV